MNFRYDIAGYRDDKVHFALVVGQGNIAVGTSGGLDLLSYPSGERSRLDAAPCTSAVVWGEAIAAGTTDGIRLYGAASFTTIDDENRGVVALAAADVDGDGREELLSLNAEGDVSLYRRPGSRPINLTKAPGASSLSVVHAHDGSVTAVLAGSTYVRTPRPSSGAWKSQLLTEELGPQILSTIGRRRDDGVLDILVVESTSAKGRLSVFSTDNLGTTWFERRAADTYAFAASLDVDSSTGSIVVGEIVGRDDGLPLNRRPRVLVYPTLDALLAGDGTEIAAGTGTWKARFGDVDLDGDREIVGVSPAWPAEVQVFKPVAEPLFDFEHRVLDRRDRQITDIVVADIDGDGNDEILSGSRFYRGPDWIPQELPEVKQALAAVDVNGDGRLEIIGTYGNDLSSEMCWLERSQEEAGWLVHRIGEGDADWPHGAAAGVHSQLGPILIAAYHKREMSPPQVWRAPKDPTRPWDKETLAHINYGEDVLVVDLDGDGVEEVVAGPWWCKWDGARWLTHRLADETYVDVTRACAADLTGNGRLDLVLTENHGDWNRRFIYQGRIAWFEQPDDPTSAWTEHVVTMRGCPHSLDVADIDGDGQTEIIVAEHDPFTGEGEEVFCRLSIFKRLSPDGSFWSEHVVDTRFEHHVGARAIKIGDSVGIVSQGWTAPHELHLWSQKPTSES